MTKYLLKGLFYSLLLYCLFGTRYVFAAAEDYYENVLRGAGLPIVSLTELKDAPHTPNQILLQLSSWQVTPEATKDYFTIIIICDNVFEYQNDFKCDRTSVISNNFPLTLVASSAEGRIEILDYRKEDVNILVIPEELLYTRTTRGSVLAYLTALNNKSLPQTALPSPASDAKQNLWLLRPSLMVQNLLILVIFGYLWTQVPKVNNIINIRSLVRFLSSGRSKATAVISGVSNFFQTNPLAAKVKKILSYLPVFLFCLTSIVFMTVSLKDTAKVDINYIDAYFSGLLNPLTLLPGQGSYFKLLLSWLLLLLTLTFVLVAWLRVLPFLQSFNMKSELNRPIHKSALKGGIVLPLLAWLLIFVSPLSSKYVVQTILLVTTLYLLILARRNKLILGSLYTNRERAFILTVGVLLAVLVGKYQPSQQEREKAGPPVPLITEQEAIAILPITRSFEPQTHFAPYVVAADQPIFINNYLVYDPVYQQIENRNLKDFEYSESYRVLGQQNKEFVEAVAKNPLIFSYLNQSPVGGLFLLDVKPKLDKKYWVEVEIDCLKNPAPYLLTAKIYGTEGTGDNVELITYGFELFYFPGCSQPYSENIVYRVPIALNSLGKGAKIGELTDFHQLGLKTVTFYEEETKLSTYFVELSKEPSIVSQRLGPGDIINYYSANISQFTVSRQDLNRLDLGAVLNSLKEDELLKNPFTIWSSAHKNLVIKNKFVVL